MKSATLIMNDHDDVKPARQVEGVLLSRGECGWQTERLPIHGCRIVDDTGRLIAADIYDEEIAEQIVREHNEAQAAKWRNKYPQTAQKVSEAVSEAENVLQGDSGAGNR